MCHRHLICRICAALILPCRRLPKTLSPRKRAGMLAKMSPAQNFAYFLFVHGKPLNKTWSTNQNVPYLSHI
jgi:hypothetical protein